MHQLQLSGLKEEEQEENFELIPSNNQHPQHSTVGATIPVYRPISNISLTLRCPFLDSTHSTTDWLDGSDEALLVHRATLRS